MEELRQMIQGPSILGRQNVHQRPNYGRRMCSDQLFSDHHLVVAKNHNQRPYSGCRRVQKNNSMLADQPLFADHSMVSNSALQQQNQFGHWNVFFW